MRDWSACRSPFVVSCRARSQIPLERHKRVCRGLVTDFVATISTCRDGWKSETSWFVSATFVICVADFHRNFTVTSPRGSFGESRRNGIWAFAEYGEASHSNRVDSCNQQSSQAEHNHSSNGKPTSLSMRSVESVLLLGLRTAKSFFCCSTTRFSGLYIGLSTIACNRTTV